MPHAVTALAPVLLLILLGLGLKRSGAMGEDMWSALEHLCYYVLFPALIVRTVALADFGSLSVLGLVLGFYTALVAATGILVLGKRALASAFGLSDAGFTSLFQACTRWHGFMALSIINALYGAAAIPVVAVALAALVPALNVVNVGVLLAWGERNGGPRPAIGRELLRNPFILSCGLGALLNATHLGLPEPLATALKSLGDGSLGISLITIGAGLKPLRSGGETGALVLGIAFRLLLMPLMFYLALGAFGVVGPVRTVAVLCGAVPTAASAYVLARNMGGDAPLMAGMITAQVMAAFVTLPVVTTILEWASGHF